MSADALRLIGSKLEPGHSALVVLFENLWERRFRDVVRGMGGSVTRQTLITAEDLRQAAKELVGAAGAG